MIDDNKALFDYWHDKVQLKKQAQLAIAQHIPTHELRHAYTNYDGLWRSREVQVLAEPERSRVIAIIKYECTAQVLQHRAGCLRDRAHELEQAYNQINQHRSQLTRFIRKLQEQIFGKDQKILRLEAQIASLSVENEALRAEVETNQAAEQLRQELAQLQQQYDAVQKRRRELARNNQSLGGRVAHTQRYKQQRDEARALVKAHERQIMILTSENRQLREANEQFLSKLKRFSEVKPTLGSEKR